MIATAITRDENCRKGIVKVIDAVCEKGGTPDLLAVFCSGYDLKIARNALESAVDTYGSATPMFGGTVAGLIHGTRELEHDQAIVAWGMRFPRGKVRVEFVDFTPGEFAGGFSTDALSKESSLALVTGDPFSFPVDLYANRCNDRYPGVPLIGGMLSAADGPGQNVVVAGNKCYDNGCSVVVFDGEVPHSILVSQGCRPIGDPMIVTGAERNIITGLGGHPALEQLTHMFRSLPASDQEMVNRGLLLGIAMSEYRDRFGYGDFLIRQVLGVDEKSQSISVSDFIRVGKTVQFQVRDHLSASADLDQQIQRLVSESKGLEPAGSLLFSCNGRGTHMFPEADHDATLLSKGIGSNEIAGFFAAGEIGPVAGTNFVHGHTATAIVFWKGSV